MKGFNSMMMGFGFILLVAGFILVLSLPAYFSQNHRLLFMLCVVIASGVVLYGSTK